ncbi:hypothetical protein UA08_09226 [Talaromyces atroroseus]|uniref:Major facilitator superfamily (MFS) profile domain-containing protein n=1 Tax=Talaromyces atroroseus TaxID=1441469 RepID=A0A1Q5Q6L3_TALAT|nr:hypothetical protein UA08_09226 [Talaromyces atroroseus]OKL55482.1 hypothetical protein UA08_09226 [Talaromyces atroroseus]
MRSAKPIIHFGLGPYLRNLGKADSGVDKRAGMYTARRQQLDNMTMESIDDMKLSTVDNEKNEVALVGEVIDPQVSKRLKLKADFILLPLLTIGYLFNSLDRSNMSNAYTAGLSEDLHLVGNQYNQVLTYYQIPFIVLGPVIAMVTKQVGAAWTIPGMMLVFGAASLATGFVKNFGSLVACRVLVGAAESGFLASVFYYLSIWYTRKELASRVGIFYAALVASSAFGGLLAYGMFQLHGDYFRWSYLFFLEGGLTLTWGFVFIFTLPSNTQTAWFLTDIEKKVAQIRLEEDSVTTLDNTFHWKKALSEFYTPHGYIRMAFAFVGGTILTSNANFLAIIVERLGFGTVKTNLYTVAPALVGAVVLVAFSKCSSHFQEHGLPITITAIISLVGYILLTVVDPYDTGVLYFAIFVCTMGAYPQIPIGASWTMANIPDLNARAMTNGLYVAVGNCAGLLSSNIYIQRQAPRYITMLITNLAMSAVMTLAGITYGAWMRWENRRRDRLHGQVPARSEGVKGTRDMNFRFKY